MKRLIIIIFILILRNQLIYPQSNPDTASVKWYSLEEAFKLQKEKPRFIFVFIYSEQDDSCKLMLDSTFTNKSIISFLNVRYYPVKINIRERNSIRYFDSVFTFNGRFHDVTAQMLDGKISLPSIVFFDKDLRKSVVRGYFDNIQLLPLLVYVCEQIFESTGLDEFKKNFFKTYPPKSKTGYSMVRSIVNWRNLDEVLKLNEQSPKKIFLVFDVNWSIPSTMMVMSTYNNQIISKILNQYYYSCRIDATTRDTLKFGVDYINPGPNPSFHQLPVSMLGGKMKFPSILILDGNSKLINVSQAYFTAEGLEPLLKYFAEDAYKKMSYNDFVKNFKPEIKP